jgi:two-component system OmpR family response regulator
MEQAMNFRWGPTDTTAVGPVALAEREPPERRSTMRVLVVEDDPAVASMLTRALQREGYTVDVADNGQDAVACGLESDYTAILLDAMIPPPDGFTVVRQLRRAGRWTPVLMLTARDGVEDRVAGLDAGADDYVTKPFAVREVLARVHALSRRVTNVPPAVLRVGDITLDPVTAEVRRGAVKVLLSGREFDLLHTLMRHPEEALTHAFLAAHVWGPIVGDRDPDGVSFWVERLRDRLDRPFGRSSVESVGLGSYRITASA